MKTLLKTVLAVIVAIVAVSVKADSSLTVTGRVQDKYLLNNGVVADNGPVNMIDGYGVYNGLWVNYTEWSSFHGNAGGKERDLGVGLNSFEISRTPLSLTAGTYIFDFVDTAKIGGADIWQLHAELTLTQWLALDDGWMDDMAKITWTPYVRIEMVRSMDGGRNVDFESMSFVGAKAHFAGTGVLTGDAKLSGVYDPGICGTEPGFLVILDESVDIHLQHGVVVTPIWIKLVDKVTGNEDFNAAFGASVAVTF